MKRIISFSSWGDRPGYTTSCIDNAELARKHYPGWICRFYCDPRVPKDVKARLLDLGSEVVDKPLSDDFLGLYWRFEPMYDDPQIERFIVRDTDSRLNAREADAVQEWVDSNLPFHICRDHVQHNIYIVGGMWGSKAGIIPDFAQLMAKWIEELEPDTANPRGIYHDTDQRFLSSVVWPFVKSCHMAHDENHRYTGRERPYRVKLRDDGYIGMVYADSEAHRLEVAE